MSGARKLGFVSLCLVAFLQAAGLATGSDGLRGVGAASAASPAPRVFTTVDGLETFSGRYGIEYRREDGSPGTVWVDSKRYRGLRGPYNRRNALGAAVAYAPVLSSRTATRPMFLAVAAHALCDGGPLWAELGVAARSVRGPFAIRLVPRPGTTTALALRVEVPCN